MSYLSKLSRNQIHQAVIGDWMLINGTRAMDANVDELIQMGFSVETASLLVNEYSYDDAIIAALEATHKDKNAARSIFVDENAKNKFSNILPIKTQEFTDILELIALQCPVDFACELAPIWIENRRVVSRIRREYRTQINNICLGLLKRKKKLYRNFDLSDSEMIDLCNLEVKGRVRQPKVEELMRIDKAIDEAKRDNLNNIKKYIYIANSACVFINQIRFREIMLAEQKKMDNEPVT